MLLLQYVELLIAEKLKELTDWYRAWLIQLTKSLKIDFVKELIKLLFQQSD